MSTQHGGTPYGASHVAGGDGPPGKPPVKLPVKPHGPPVPGDAILKKSA